MRVLCSRTVGHSTAQVHPTAEPCLLRAGRNAIIHADASNCNRNLPLRPTTSRLSSKSGQLNEQRRAQVSFEDARGAGGSEGLRSSMFL